MNAPDVHLLVLTDDLALAERIHALLESMDNPAFRCRHAAAGGDQPSGFQSC